MIVTKQTKCLKYSGTPQKPVFSACMSTDTCNLGITDLAKFNRDCVNGKCISCPSGMYLHTDGSKTPEYVNAGLRCSKPGGGIPIAPVYPVSPPSIQVCPEGSTGIYPNCVIPCPPGTTGVFPNCAAPTAVVTTTKDYGWVAWLGVAGVAITGAAIYLAKKKAMGI